MVPTNSNLNRSYGHLIRLIDVLNGIAEHWITVIRGIIANQIAVKIPMYVLKIHKL